MKKILIIQTILALIISIVLMRFGTTINAISFLMGSIFMLANMYMWNFLISLLFSKKYIALPSTLIVIKYAILGIFIYYISRLKIDGQNINMLLFGLGIGLIVFTLITLSLFEQKLKGRT